MRKILPIIDVLRNYDVSGLKGDAVAGVTAGVMMVPQGMAYAMIAGLPPVYGLYAAIFPQVVYAWFGTSRQLSVGPVAMDSLLVATGISALAVAGTSDYIGLAILLALMIGLLQLAMGVFRLGFLTNFLSRPVIAGFTSAAVFVIAINHLKHLTGVELISGKYLHDIVIDLMFRLDEINGWTLLIGLTGMVLIVVLKRWSPKLPTGLILVVVSAGVVYGFRLDTLGVAIVGYVPEGLPSVAIPTWDLEQVRALAPMALTLAFIGFIEAYSIGRTLQYKHKNEYEVKANKELIALGLGNMIGSLFSSFPTTGSFSRSAVNDAAGAKTTVALFFSALVVLLVLLFLTPLFYYLPSAILASIIIVSVLGLIDIEEVKTLWRTDKYDFAMLMVSFVGTIMFGIEWGILFGVLLSLVVLIYKASIPHIAELGQIEGTRFFRNIKRFDQAYDRPDVGIIRFDARLFFANVSALQETIRTILAKKPEMKLFVIDAQSISDIDSTAISALRDIHVDMQNRGITLKLTSIIGPVRDKLYRCGLADQIGLENIHESIAAAINSGQESDLPFQSNSLK
ncbi:sulfate permease [Gilvimarinus agarilyticus]|uniref:SulP family inorganic anion transporter n=1 Tax=Reichenbachiella agariperforans TaxID=156994 RepID=UPI001C084C10|nr:sulfate permease [Reichenbachiella agariperforans]MBU2885872.1 sulfate permease [Gilvimarinus agarilyticus]MBU2915255.1 sulfate permease [Reichenbachiella agariperforans]